MKKNPLVLALLLLLGTGGVSTFIGSKAKPHGLLSKKVIDVGLNCQGDEVSVTVEYLRQRLGEVDYDADLIPTLETICKLEDKHNWKSYIKELLTDIFIIKNKLKADNLSDWIYAQLTHWAWLILAILFVLFSVLAIHLKGVEGPVQLLLLIAGVLAVLVPFLWMYDKTALYSLESLPAAIVGLISAILTFAWNYLTKKNKLTNPE